MNPIDPTQLLEDLMAKLFRRIPELLEEVAPEGFEKSAYYWIHRLPVEKEYLNYLEREVMWYLLGKEKQNDKPFPNLQKYEDYKTEVASRRVDAKMEMACILCRALELLETLGYFIDVKTRDLFRFDHLLPYIEILNKASKRAGFVKQARNNYFSFLQSWNSATDEMHPPIFRYIFRVVHELGLEWHYHPANLALAVGLQGRGEENEKLSQILDNEFAQLKKEMPPNYIISYFDVYGDWPKGYPPEIADYRR